MYAKESYCNNNIMYDFIDVKFSLKKKICQSLLIMIMFVEKNEYYMRKKFEKKKYNGISIRYNILLKRDTTIVYIVIICCLSPKYY